MRARRTNGKARRRLGLAACLTVTAFAGAAPSAQAAEVLLATDGAGGTFARLLSLDPATGAVISSAGNTGAAIVGIAEDPTTGILYGVSSRDDPRAPGFLFTIDQVTGAATQIGDLVPPATNLTEVSDITFTPDGTLYGWQETAEDLVTIDKTTGLATVVGNSGLGTNQAGLAADTGGNLYLAVTNVQPLRSVDRTTGAVTPGATLQGTADFRTPSLAFSAQNALFAVQQNTTGEILGNLLTIDVPTGALSPRPEVVGQLDGIEFVDGEARSITLAASKKKVKKNKKVTLSGTVTAGGGCASGQPVVLQRFEDSAFVDLKVIPTDAAGAYSTTEKLKATTSYRATVSGPTICEDAVSPTVKVKVKKKKSGKG
jgi:hypothetical protein